MDVQRSVNMSRRSVIHLSVDDGRTRFRALFVSLFSALVLTLVTMVTTLVALAVNAASERNVFPAGLDVIQRYPFPSVLVLTLILAVLGWLLLWVQQAQTERPSRQRAGTGYRSGVDAVGPGPEPSPAPTENADQRQLPDVEVSWRTGVVEAPVGELPVVVRGRADVVTALVDVATAGQPRVRVVTGMGGCGKTTVALAAADVAHGRGWRVWWVSAVDSASLMAGMSEVAREAGASPEEVKAADSDTALLGLVWRWLQRLRRPWLLIIDNADDPAVLAPPGTSLAGGTGWVREGDSGLVVVTSRVTDAQVWGARARLVPLGVLAAEPAALLLLDRMGRIATPPKPGGIEPELLEQARAVAARLGYLPLALHLAGSYLGSGVAEVGLAGYLATLEARSIQLLELGAPGWGPQDPRRGVMSTWEMSLDALAAQGRGQARGLLRVLSFLAAGSLVPVSMLDPRVLAEVEVLSPPEEEWGAELAAGLAGLRAVGLIDSVPVGGSTGDGLLVHPLVAEVSRLHARRSGEERDFAATAAVLVAIVYVDLDPTDPRDRQAWQLLAPHALALLRAASLLDDEVLAHVVAANASVANFYLALLGSHAAAIDLGIEALTTAEQVLGDEHPVTLSARNNLAYAYQAASRLSEAIPLYEATLSVMERVVGDQEPATLTARNDLAKAYLAAGRLAESITLHETALADMARVMGEEDLETLGARTSLASAYQTAGRLNEAIQLFESSLSVLQRLQGDEHPNTLTVRNNLALAQHAAGRLDEAVRLYEATLASQERLLGPEHPDTLLSRNNLAYAYQTAGRLDEAIHLYEAIVTSSERVLGNEHTNTLTTRSNLANAYQAAGRLDEAIPLHEATLAAAEQLLGTDHPNTLLIRNNLALAHHRAGRLDDAISRYEAIVTSSERVLGNEHPNTLLTRNNLAGAYQEAGRLDEAISRYEATLAAVERHLGAEHPHALLTRSNLAMAYEEAGRLDEAISLYEVTLAAAVRVLGENHPDTLDLRACLDDAYELREELREEESREEE